MKRLESMIISAYRQMVEKIHPDMLDNWPILSGYNLRYGKFHGWTIVLFEHNVKNVFLKIPLDDIPQSILGITDIGGNLDFVRKKLSRYFRMTPQDSLLILNSRASNLEEELKLVLERHESAIKVKTEEKESPETGDGNN